MMPYLFPVDNAHEVIIIMSEQSVKRLLKGSFSTIEVFL